MSHLNKEEKMTATPPHDPTHNVKFTSVKITRILTRVFPERSVKSIEQLRSGDSFNNHIYIVNLVSSANQVEENVVLKVSGQFFGAAKVQNEVASLYLLERYCPLVPAPRVLAWSGNGVEGEDIQVFKRSGHRKDENFMEMTTFAHPSNDDGSSERGWLLLSKRPGRVLDHSDLAGQTGEQIMRDLAHMVSQIRREMPTSECIGNLKWHPITSTSQNLHSRSSILGNGFRIEIEGLLNCFHVPENAICSALQYYQTRLQDQLIKLNTEDVFASKRAAVSAIVKSFLTDRISKLQLTQQSAPPTFTHYDFSPQNILVSGSPPTVTGLIDFEFAGFFPPEEEFANNAVCNDGDWPAPAYETFLLELERLGVPTPLKGFPEKSWTEAVLLMKLIEDVAPWFLREGCMEAEELQRECQKAADGVVTCVEKLQGLSEDRPRPTSIGS